MEKNTRNVPASSETGQDAPERVLEPWDKQPGESPQAYSRFRIYLSLRNRSAPSVAEALGLTAEYTRDLIHDRNWKSRAAAYDTAEAEQVAADTYRERTTAISSILRHIVDAVSTLRIEEGERVDPKYLLALSGVVKNLTPGMDVLLSSGPVGEDLITMAFESAYKARGAALESSAKEKVR